jgi:hypothetical protein
MFFQFATDETLVPPNFRTTHGEAPAVGSAMVILFPTTAPGMARGHARRADRSGQREA